MTEHNTCVDSFIYKKFMNLYDKIIEIGIYRYTKCIVWNNIGNYCILPILPISTYCF